MQSIILSPAYGRDYKSKAALLADWDAGKDFVLHSIWEAGYCSVRDLTSFADQGIDSINFRYGKMRKVFVLPVVIPPELPLPPVESFDVAAYQRIAKGDFLKFSR